MSKQIVLTFNTRTGATQVEASGFKGSECERATKFIGDALGQVMDFQKKAEWFETNLELGTSINTKYCG